MSRTFGFVVVVAFLAGQAKGDTLQSFSDSFNLFGNYTQYLYSTTNATVGFENWGSFNVEYWCPTTGTAPATIEYKFPLSFQATSGTLTAPIDAWCGGNLPTLDPSAYAYLDVSPDGVQWTNVAGSYPGNGGDFRQPYDISSIIDGSNDVWVRCQLYSDSSPYIYSQFLRTNGDNLNNPPPFDIQIQGVAEPSTVALLCPGAIGLLVYGWWKRRRNTANRSERELIVIRPNFGSRTQSLSRAA